MQTWIYVVVIIRLCCWFEMCLSCTFTQILHGFSSRNSAVSLQFYGCIVVTLGYPASKITGLGAVAVGFPKRLQRTIS